METVLIGNGWYDPITQYEAYYNYSVSPGNTYDVTFKNPITRKKMHDAMYGKGEILLGMIPIETLLTIPNLQETA